MNENQQEDEHEMKAKETICWNIAISQASLNIYGMEANSAIAAKKRDIKHLHRRYLAGKAQMEKQFKDISFEDEIWETKTKDALLKDKLKHEQSIKKMTENHKKKIQELKNEISESNQKISEYQKIINESNEILKNRVPTVDVEIIGDLNELRRAIQKENERIDKLESIQSQGY